MSDDTHIIPLHPQRASCDPFLLPAITEARQQLEEEHQQTLALLNSEIAAEENSASDDSGDDDSGDEELSPQDRLAQAEE